MEVTKIDSKDHLEYLSEIYSDDINNRHLAFNLVGLKFGLKNKINIILLTIAIMIKSIIAKIVGSTSKNSCISSIAISWSNQHTKRFADLEHNPGKIISYDYKNVFSLNNMFFSEIPIFRIFEFAFKLNNESINKSHDHYDFFFYRACFITEWYVMNNIITKYNPNKIYIAGLFDRLSIIICSIATLKGGEIHMLQHGVLGKRQNMALLTIHKFYYLYEFSIDFLKYVIRFNKVQELKYLPKKRSQLTLQQFNKNSKPNIAYASTHVKHELNEAIVDEIISCIPTSINLLIYLHPQENIEVYKKYIQIENVFFFKRERHKNIELLITRFSTIGIDFFECGIKPIFVNLDGLELDFLLSNKFTCYNNTKELQIMLHQINSTINNEVK